MLLPHGANFLGRSQLATRNFGFGFGKIGIFLRRQLDRRLIHAGKLQQNARKLVLLRVREGRNFAKRLFQQPGHGERRSQQKGPGKTGAF
jgi:hypothetical protein